MLFDTKGHIFERDIIMLNVRWYLSYKLSYRDLEEMAAERGLEVDHTTIYNTGDYLLTSKRDRKAAKRFICRAVGSNVEPLKINIDKSGANAAGINAYNKDKGTNIEIRQNKYLNNIIE